MQKTHQLQALVLLLSFGQGYKYQPPKQLRLSTRASPVRPMLPGWGCLSWQLGSRQIFWSHSGSNRATSRFSFPQKEACLPLQAGSTVQARTWSPAKLEPVWNTKAQSPDKADSRSTAQLFAPLWGQQLHLVCMWAENSAWILWIQNSQVSFFMQRSISGF